MSYRYVWKANYLIETNAGKNLFNFKFVFYLQCTAASPVGLWGCGLNTSSLVSALRSVEGRGQRARGKQRAANVCGRNIDYETMQRLANAVALPETAMRESNSACGNVQLYLPHEVALPLPLPIDKLLIG